MYRLKPMTSIIVSVVLFISIVSCSDSHETPIINFSERSDGTYFSSDVCLIQANNNVNRELDFVFSYKESTKVISYNVDMKEEGRSYYSIIDVNSLEEKEIEAAIGNPTDYISVADNVFLLSGNHLFSLDIINGKINAVTSDEYSGNSKLIRKTDGFALYSNYEITNFDFEGNKQDSFYIKTDSLLHFSYPVLFSDKKVYLVHDECPIVSFYEYDISSSQEKYICSNVDIGFRYSQFYGNWIVDEIGINHLILDERVVQNVTKWNDIDVRPPTATIEKEKTLFIGDHNVFYEVYEYINGSIELLKFKHDTFFENVSSRETMVIGGYGVTDDPSIQWAVYLFNTSQNEYRAILDEYNLKYPHSNTQEAAIARANMIEDFSAGDAPDIFYGFDFDYQNWGVAGMVIDLMPYLQRDDLLPDITESVYSVIENNGTCYQLFPAYSITGYFGKSEYFDCNNASIYTCMNISDMTGIPLYCQLYAYNVADMTLRYEVEEVANNRNLMSQDRIRDVIEYALKYGVSYDYMLTQRASLENVRSDEFLLAREEVFTINNYSEMLAEVGDDSLRYIGFPFVDDSSHVINPVGCVAISSSANDYDACWQFISNLMNPTIQRIMVANGTIPVNKEILNEYLTCASSHELIVDEIEQYYSVLLLYDEVPNQYVVSFREMVDSIDTVAIVDWGLFNLISEEINSYYIEGRDVDSIAVSLYSRYQLYMDENYS